MGILLVSERICSFVTEDMGQSKRRWEPLSCILVLDNSSSIECLKRKHMDVYILIYTAMFFHFMTAIFVLALSEITYGKYKSQRPSSMEYTGRSMQK